MFLTFVPHECRLSSAIRSEQTEKSGVDSERHAVQRADAVSLREITNNEHDGSLAAHHCDFTGDARSAFVLVTAVHIRHKVSTFASKQSSRGLQLSISRDARFRGMDPARTEVAIKNRPVAMHMMAAGSSARAAEGWS
jgi:hypothetical protein